MLCYVERKINPFEANLMMIFVQKNTCGLQRKEQDLFPDLKKNSPAPAKLCGTERIRIHNTLPTLVPENI